MVWHPLAWYVAPFRAYIGRFLPCLSPFESVPIRRVCDQLVTTVPCLVPARPPLFGSSQLGAHRSLAGESRDGCPAVSPPAPDRRLRSPRRQAPTEQAPESCLW